MGSGVKLVEIMSESPRSHEFVVHAIGFVRSSLAKRGDAPRQGDEGAPDAWIDVRPSVIDALDGLEPGQDVVLLTFLHLAQRDVLKVHPRGDASLPLTGIFATRAPGRPNPIGLHVVTIRAIDGDRLRVGPLEAIDGTPVLDIKPLLPREDRAL